MTVRDAKKGRVAVVNGRKRYFLRCSVCNLEYNVSPEQEIDGAYRCPVCGGFESEKIRICE